MIGRLSIVGCVMGLLAGTAFGQTAGMLSFQGLISDGGGNPISPVSGTVDLVFRIYDAQSGGSPVDMDGDGTVEDVIGEDAKEVLGAGVVNGVVSTKFGPVAPSAFDGTERWLEVIVTVDGSPMTLSRMEIATAPATAEQLNIPGTGTAAAVIDAAGNVGIATRSPEARLHVSGGASGSGALVTDYRMNPLFAPASHATLTLRASSKEGFLDAFTGTGSISVSAKGQSSSRGVTLKAHDLDMPVTFETQDVERMRIDPSGRVGIGTTNPDHLVHLRGASPSLMIEDAGTGPAYLRFNRAGEPDTNYIALGNGNNMFFKVNDIDRMVINDIGVSVAGRTTTQVLEITGGSDLSERFDIDARGIQLEPGMVVSIDPDHPGRLTPSRVAYDRTVAGIISGAGDVKPGMLMGQRGTRADGEYPVALTGRVWCWSDASNGVIRPGDLLTTSPTPGHAMKVTDHTAGQGAVLGKAMTFLTEGRGLVLVLVSLQ